MKFLAAALFLTFFTFKALAQDTLYVGSYNTGQILRYDQTGNITQPDPWLGPGGNSANNATVVGEGIAVGEGYPTTGGYAFGDVADPVYIADATTQSIEVANGNAATGVNPIVNASFITGLNVVADIALSKNGNDLYVAQEAAGSVTEYNALTGAEIATVTGITDAHDVAVSANGTVYVTAYGAGTAQSVGVIDFSANLTNRQTFVPAGMTVAPGVTLDHATGMVFDSSGDLWVANVYTQNNSVIGAPLNAEDFVSEFSSNGTLLKTIEATGNHLWTVFGLSLGPDGNIYAGSFSGGEITEINTTTDALSTFITLPAGDEPKYSIWQSDFETFTPVPEPKAYAALTLGGVALLIALRRFKRAFQSTA